MLFNISNQNIKKYLKSKKNKIANIRETSVILLFMVSVVMNATNYLKKKNQLKY